VGKSRRDRGQRGREIVSFRHKSEVDTVYGTNLGELYEMGYTTDFDGSIQVQPALSQEEADFIQAFSESRRMNRKNGPYCIVKEKGVLRDLIDADIIDCNQPPPGQPGVWCHWAPNEDATEIKWNNVEKFYHADKWMGYIIEHFLGSSPTAKTTDPVKFAFLQGHILNGDIFASGERSDDLWKIEVHDNVVTRIAGHVASTNEPVALP
jgi:hypothetical protein